MTKVEKDKLFSLMNSSIKAKILQDIPATEVKYLLGK